ncbi:RNase H domain-containing protein [Caerostris extrusa]|uniref:RNase H domain-containing protein n=1 Tax=Caerostris extrusa TaxID=172846 RepID=A0AAV4NUQ3_CAEEX|nr:RNase H domain-containing protein [Caerostris extrusa]
MKKAEERKPLDFRATPVFSYNQVFHVKELKNYLKQSNSSTPEPDEIHYDMLKNLSENSLMYILNLCNMIWLEHVFTVSWRKAIVIAIPKLGQISTNPNSHSPIALTSCLYNLMERVINTRFLYILKNEKRLSQFQGFRFGRSAID